MDSLIPRELYLRRLRPFMSTEVIKVVTGVRRSGKSTLLKLAERELLAGGEPPDRMLSLNLESMANAELADLPTFYQRIASRVPPSGMLHVFLDEPQEVEGWQKVVNSLQVDYPGSIDFYITGSNSKLLSSEFATLLSGRYVETKVYPFGFSEFLQLYGLSHPGVSESEGFMRYLELGGIPALAKVGFDPEASEQYLQSIYDTILLKDIFRRHEVRNPRMFDDVMRYAVAHSGHTFSTSSISKAYEGRNIRVAPATIGTYMDYAVESNFLVRARREDVMTRKVFTSREKYYLADHGFRQALYGRNIANVDVVLENVIFMELLRQGWSVRVGALKEREVDFIGTRGSDHVYVQVCYLLAEESTREREFGVLERIRDNYPKYVLSMDELPMGRNGIIHMNVRDFLLDSPIGRNG